MERVAHHLQRAAIERRDTPHDFDLFGRSAFNRYYYALFLVVRATVLRLNPKWEGDHSGLPGVLVGDLYKQIGRFRTSAHRKQDKETVELCNRALAAMNELSELMRGANAVRVTADYNPQVPVIDQGSDRFTLGPTNITTAHSWPERARVLTSHVNRAWSVLSGGS